MRTERVCLPFEIKAAGESDGLRTFEGYGSVFGTIDSYNDTIEKGAFRSTLKEWKTRERLPKMLLQHGGGFLAGADDMIPIGKWTEMREDDHGLFMKGHLFDVETDRARATYAALKAGELDGLSIGFRARKSKMNEETRIRTLTDIQLFEVSLVTFPANDPARVTGVKEDGVLPTEREFERWLRRDAGLTESQAKAVISKGYRQVRREAMPSEEACEAFADACQDAIATLTGVKRHGTDTHRSQGGS